ncbi:MAG: aldehyde dehydrogenase family protein [Hyphomicrobiales bacterium]|nr:aldehyde dehydrogenase family protein [Hyphomicrobiales bacterium]
MTETVQCISPVDGSVYAERPLVQTKDIESACAAAARAQAEWRQLAISERADYCERAVGAMEAMRADIVPELAWQMGRPVAQGPSEIGGFAERARHMIAIATSSLADIVPEPKPGFTRAIRREPRGIVFTIAPWNYPYLTAVNSVIPALMAGNAVILKAARQTLLAGERFQQAFDAAGLPQGLFCNLVLSHEQTAGIISAGLVDMVCFTGSVDGGKSIERSAAGHFIPTGLELGGKDPAYVRADADIEFAIENLVDGAFFNSGQSCCGIERIYVQKEIHGRFVAAFIDTAGRYRLGDPLDEATTLGPMVNATAADYVRGQTKAALTAGASAHLDEGAFPASAAGTPYLAPQVLTGVDHQMAVMREETFGPLVGIMGVTGDEEAITLMNDSPFGLTASVWTEDEDAAFRIAERVDTGTFFMNRCDYLDPALAWTGVGDSGCGCTLSALGYEQLTRPKSFHFRTRKAR